MGIAYRFLVFDHRLAGLSFAVRSNKSAALARQGRIARLSRLDHAAYGVIEGGVILVRLD
jgi:hypothetical protein